MKTLKITLALVAVLVLTVSGVQSETTLITDNEIHQPTKIDLTAHVKKKKASVPSQG